MKLGKQVEYIKYIKDKMFLSEEFRKDLKNNKLNGLQTN